MSFGSLADRDRLLDLERRRVDADDGVVLEVGDPDGAEALGDAARRRRRSASGSPSTWAVAMSILRQRPVAEVGHPDLRADEDAERVVADADRVADGGAPRRGRRAAPCRRPCWRPRRAAGRARCPGRPCRPGSSAVVTSVGSVLEALEVRRPWRRRPTPCPCRPAIWSGLAPTSRARRRARSVLRVDLAERAVLGVRRRRPCSPSAVMPSGPSPTGIVVDDLGRRCRLRRRRRRSTRRARAAGRAACSSRRRAGSTPGRAERGDASAATRSRHGSATQQRDAAAPRPAGGAGGLAAWRRARRLGLRGGRRRRRHDAGGGVARRRRVGRARRLPGGVAGGDAAGLLRRRARPAARPRPRARGRPPRRSASSGSFAIAVPITASSAAGTPGASAARGGRGIAEVRVHLRQLGVARERRAAGQRVEEDAAERVDVGAGVGAPRRGSAPAPTKSGVPDELAGARDPAHGRGVLGQAEVGQVGVLVPLAARSGRSAA